MAACILTKEVISKTSLLSFPQAKRVGNPSEKKDSGQAGMTKLRFACGSTNDRISKSVKINYDISN